MTTEVLGTAPPLLLRRILHERALRFTVVAEAYPNHVNYTLYNIVSCGDSETFGQHDEPFCPQVGSHESDQSDQFEEAEFERYDERNAYLHGTVNADGCSDWFFDEQDRGRLYASSKQELQRFGDVMALCWQMTAELCPGWDGE